MVANATGTEAQIEASSGEDKFITACEDCDYDAILHSDLANTIFEGTKDNGIQSFEQYLHNLDERVAKVADATEPTRYHILLLGVSLLNAFLQVNYTGPALPRKSNLLLPKSLVQLPLDVLHGMVLDHLVVDGERPYPLVEDLTYLALASRIIKHKSMVGLESQALWHVRVSFVHQKLLDDPVSSIHNIICDEETMAEVDKSFTDRPDMQAKWHLELAHYYSYYSYDQKAMFQVQEAQRTSGLNMKISGALGRRTKFQTFDVSQLVVLAKSAEVVGQAPTAERPTIEKSVPLELDLDDDTLLENVSFSTTNVEAPYAKRYINPVADVVAPESLPAELAALDPGNQPQLSLIDQCILLTYAGVIKISAASDDQIIIEQVAAYIARVLQKMDGPKNAENNWTVNSSALLARTRVEGHRSRTVERSVLQLQALVDQLVDEIAQDTTLPQVTDEEARAPPSSAQTASFLRRADQKNSAPAKERLMPLFCLPLASKWDLQLELARKYTSIGLVRSALEIFERLESWEQVAMCYGVMDREDKAESILRTQIEAAKPGSDMPKLWCLLGDVTADAQYWEKSWQVSNCRYARAQRSLGKWHFGRKEHQRAIESYAKSLKINPLNHGAWFYYGCAGLETNQFEVAAEAFTRCISIDQTDGESWNNLASALLRLGRDRKRDAWQALKTATDLKYDSWRMWENYMLVSMDLQELGETVRAMRRCIDIRRDAGESAVDLDVLQLLVQHVLESNHPTEDDDGDDHPDGEAESLRGVSRMVYDLLTKTIQPLITHDARLWRILGKVYVWRKKYSEALEAHEKAYRCLAARPVETEWPAFALVVDAVEELTDAYRNLGPMPGRMGGLVAKDWRFKSKSVVRSLKARGGNFEDSPEYQRLADLLDDLKTSA
ncbi:TPR repeat-containing protein [Taphrina deformans PYCC 5710]|uniref:TPR repeat-containing protein n=1 Tax=Taphrina deformans (strain PYCC 5710 / ATCC 11124 / CBS 356.35 / IMI 108563 / JCM 9778 / NBRC 8474) TaxID=1097556 RepID=R4X957_TAPDE|nr:TPR repeat-containing protein [Taphrina deformans PYCC 5710]|eukprot:CCG80702.1 TPR repeat-containing protein [Taphrina deformans PYCC 5710]